MHKGDSANVHCVCIFHEVRRCAMLLKLNTTSYTFGSVWMSKSPIRYKVRLDGHMNAIQSSSTYRYLQQLTSLLLSNTRYEIYLETGT